MPIRYGLSPCNFDYWLKFDSWPIKQAGFILIGVEPPPLEALLGVNSSRANCTYSIHEEYESLMVLIQNAALNGALPSQDHTQFRRTVTHVKVADFLGWAVRTDQSVPDELQKKFDARVNEAQWLQHLLIRQSWPLVQIPFILLNANPPPLLEILKDQAPSGDLFGLHDPPERRAWGYPPGYDRILDLTKDAVRNNVLPSKRDREEQRHVEYLPRDETIRWALANIPDLIASDVRERFETHLQKMDIQPEQPPPKPPVAQNESTASENLIPRERNNLHKTIAVFVLLLFDRVGKYKHGNKPNAKNIAEAANQVINELDWPSDGQSVKNLSQLISDCLKEHPDVAGFITQAETNPESE